MLKAASKLVSTDQLITPISLAGDVTLSTGNLVIGTSGKGIDFSATAGTGTSELLADYEEGTWTPSAATPPTVNSATYTKVGRQVTCLFDITGVALTSDITGLPFVPAGFGSGIVGSHSNVVTTATYSILVETSSKFSFRIGVVQQNLEAGKTIRGALTYFV